MWPLGPAGFPEGPGEKKEKSNSVIQSFSQSAARKNTAALERERLSEDVHREVLAFREVGDQADKLGRRMLEHGWARYWSGRDRAGRGG